MFEGRTSNDPPRATTRHPTRRSYSVVPRFFSFKRSGSQKSYLEIPINTVTSLIQLLRKWTTKKRAEEPIATTRQTFQQARTADRLKNLFEIEDKFFSEDEKRQLKGSSRCISQEYWAYFEVKLGKLKIKSKRIARKKILIIIEINEA